MPPRLAMSISITAFGVFVVRRSSKRHSDSLRSRIGFHPLLSVPMTSPDAHTDMTSTSDPIDFRCQQAEAIEYARVGTPMDRDVRF